MKLEIEDAVLKIELSWWEKLLSFHGDFSIPLYNIVSVELDRPKQGWKELRAPGTFFPGLIKAGSYRNEHGKEYWFLVYNGKPITLTLKNENFDRLIIGVDDNQYWQMMITNKLVK